MKALIVAIALAAGLVGSAAAASWGYPGFELAAQGQKGRPDRGPQGRDARHEGRGGDDRRERLNDDERRQLHRDLDKANRELYRQRPR